MAKPLRITSNFCYITFDDDTKVIVQVWKLMGIPFTFEACDKQLRQVKKQNKDAVCIDK